MITNKNRNTRLNNDLEITRADPECEKARINVIRAQQAKQTFLEALARRRLLPWYANLPAESATRIKRLEDDLNTAEIHRFDQIIVTNLEIFYRIMGKTPKTPPIIERLEAYRQNPDIREILKEIHGYGFVCKEGLAAILNVRPALIDVIMEELRSGNWVNYLGRITNCIYQDIFHDKDFFTVTDKGITEICPGIKRFNPQSSCASSYVSGYFLEPGDEPERDSNGIRKLLGRFHVRVPVRLVGAHLAAAFLASVIDEYPGAGRGIFLPASVLKRDPTPMSPVPDGVCLSGGTGLRLAFEVVYHKRRQRACERRLKASEPGAFPTIYIALNPEMLVALDRAGQDQKRVTVVMYGDMNGCRKAYEGLLADQSWESPKRYLDGPKAGYILEKATDERLPVTGF